MTIDIGVFLDRFYLVSEIEETRILKMRSAIALMVCMVFIGTSAIPASSLPCCCSAKKIQSRCCEVPEADPQNTLPACCKAGSAEPYSPGSLSENNGLDSSSLTQQQLSLRCHCASHTKAPLLADSRSLSPGGHETLSPVLADIATMICASGIVPTVSKSPLSAGMHPLLKSSSLRI